MRNAQSTIRMVEHQNSNSNPKLTTLKELREYLGLTQEELGQALGITASTISRYERGQHQRIKFTFSQIKRLQALLEQGGLSINDLPDDID